MTEQVLMGQLDDPDIDDEGVDIDDNLFAIIARPTLAARPPRPWMTYL